MASDPPAPPRRESQCFLGSNGIPSGPLKGSHRVREEDTHIFNYMDCLLLSFSGNNPREFGRQKQHALENEGSQMREAYLVCWCSKLEQADSSWDVCIACWEL